MARKQKQVVRIVLPDGMNPCTPEIRQFIECLRYAGIATVHRDNAEGICFDLHCPAGLEDAPWAQMNAARMRSFTYNAVSAPGTAHLHAFTVKGDGAAMESFYVEDESGKPVAGPFRTREKANEVALRQF